jgi:hypothetical protein
MEFLSRADARVMNGFMQGNLLNDFFKVGFLLIFKTCPKHQNISHLACNKGSRMILKDTK